MKKALVLGICGQDGSYLAELLLERGYEVHGIIRPSSTINTGRIDHLYSDPHEVGGRLHLHYGDLLDMRSIEHVLLTVKPDEIYNLAAQSHVQRSFVMPKYTHDVNHWAVGSLLNLIQILQLNPKIYQASSSEMFGNSPAPQYEHTPFDPQSPYAISKVGAHEYIQWMRDKGYFAVSGILFNHESERRGETFVTRKITKAAARIKLGLQKKLYLGNLDACRDWGYAKEYVEAIYLMMQQETPDDYVIATGTTHSVKDFLDEAFGYLNLDWRDYVEIDPKYYRPREVNYLCGDPEKASRVLGWEPKTTFKQLVRRMVDADARMIQALAPSYATLSL